MRFALSRPVPLVALSPMTQVSTVQRAPPTVGVIDPDPLAREELRKLLVPIGVDVLTYDSAESFLRVHHRKRLACLIVDLLLPGMSGLELLRQLRSSGNDVPLILLAGESDVPTAVAAIREGATDFIEKPYMNVAVLKQVQKLLHTKGSGTLNA